MDGNVMELEVLDEGRDGTEIVNACCTSGNMAKIK